MSALTQEKPNEDKDETAEGKKTDFDWQRPAGSKQNKSVDDAKTNRIEIATREDDFLG